MDDAGLVAMAREGLERAHAPYSGYRVGAALLTTDGNVVTGCNLEVANFTNSLHAEEVALARAIAGGHESFTALAVSSSRQDGVTPCGMCRQTLFEFCSPDLRVLCDTGDGLEEWTLEELLPAPFGGEFLDD